MAAILDSLVVSCATKLQVLISEEVILILGVKEELNKLKEMMYQIQDYLDDAEKKRTEYSAVKNWLSQLKDYMYETDDIIDIARVKGKKLLPNLPSSSINPASFTDSLFCSCIPNILIRHKIAIKIRNLNTTLDKTLKLGKRLSLQTMQGKAKVSVVRQTWHLGEPNIVGKEILHACKELTELILKNKGSTTYKLGIVGTGGVGKTTLAQKIYNDDKIKGKFSKRVWICVSQDYNERDLIKQILRKVDVPYQPDETIGELAEKLKVATQNESFFLVLDDVWQHEIWTNLLRIPFATAATTTVLITTRNDLIARAIGVQYMHRVDLMSPEVGWDLLCKSMNITEDIEVQNLRNTGSEIVRLCGGLPLAIKVTGSVLATKERNENEWRKVISKSAWSMHNFPHELSGALYLSYDELPQHLKQCFLFCALYPEDFSIYRDDIVRFWIARGFVQEQEDQVLEDTAEDYYYELIYRNLLQPDHRFLADYSRCKMHDLLRKLAEHLSGEEFFYGDPYSLEGKFVSKLRHISIVPRKEFLGVQKELVGVRTFICHKAVDNAIFRRLKKVRVLDLSGSTIQRIPHCIRHLIHLRLLDLDETNISCLPESIYCLVNLQILNLQMCHALHSLPSGITQLWNLRRLGLQDTPVTQVPKGIGGLKFLNDLSGFLIGGGHDNSGAKMQDGWNLEELSSLFMIRRLDIIKLERSTPCSTCPLLHKYYLKELNLECTERLDEPYSEEDVINVEKIFEQLVPPRNLEELVINQFYGQNYPPWLEAKAITHLSSLKYMQLRGCKSCVQLPPIGLLPELKYLKIVGANAVSKIGPEFAGYRVGNLRSTEAVTFPKLETLIIWDMPNWEEWTFAAEGEEATTASCKERGSEDGAAEIQQAEEAPCLRMHLPRLKELKLNNCPKLRALPRQLGHIATSLKQLHLTSAGSIKSVEDFPFLSGCLQIKACHGLEKVSNLPQAQELRVVGCPRLTCVEKLPSLRLLGLLESMQEVSSLWLPGLQQQRRELHDEDLDVIIGHDDVYH